MMGIILLNFEVKLGKLQLIGGIFKQKMIDVLMSLDIVDKCFDNQIQHAILIAGDSDFIPAIKKAKNYGAIIHLFYHPSSVHNELLTGRASEFLDHRSDSGFIRM